MPIKITKTYIVELSEEQARLLKGYVQNALIEKEDPAVTELRYHIFHQLKEPRE